MAYFLRVTQNPEKDVERKTSLHQTDIEITREEFSKVMKIVIENCVAYEVYHTRCYCKQCGSEAVEVNSAGGTHCNSCNSWGTAGCPDEDCTDENGECQCDLCVGMRNHPRNN